MVRLQQGLCDLQPLTGDQRLRPLKPEPFLTTWPACGPGDTAGLNVERCVNSLRLMSWQGQVVTSQGQRARGGDVDSCETEVTARSYLEQNPATEGGSVLLQTPLKSFPPAPPRGITSRSAPSRTINLPHARPRPGWGQPHLLHLPGA
ncbi:hypothetical protein AAFF_G00346650 [Aldrovandia affinis]|uniref:Uncharacterized protein n=1 Tax=Aldrovandia affinis TaxID=143900 RepID=A0AAD7WNU4_9TELE|nr:hypothetical protein AAFF_G00346650 [Aldrovandia affinis]